MAEFEDNFDKEIKKLTEKQIDNYYKKDITDGLSDEQRAYLYFKDQSEAYAEVMGDNFNEQKMDDSFADSAAREPSPEARERYERAGIPDSPYQGLYPEDMAIDAMQMDEEDFIKQIEIENNIPKGSISKLGLALDPISEGLEFALKGIGLGSIANWWIRAEVANLVAGMIRGAGAGSAVAQLGQSQALMGEEITGDSEQILDTFKTNLGQQMKLSPGLWLENKYAQSKFGKGQTPTQQGYNWAKDALGFGK